MDALRKASWEIKVWFARESRRILTGLLTSVCLDSVLAEEHIHPRNIRMQHHLLNCV